MRIKVTFCNCQSKIAEPNKLEILKNQLLNSDIDLTIVTDLCGLCATDKSKAEALFTDNENTTIIACFPRVLKLLAEYIDVKFDENRVEILNIREIETQHFVERIQKLTSENSEKAKVTEIKSSEDWQSWYPVIDYDRCTACGQCADFCLFGVYEKSEKRVNVINPERCKNNCPVCARICPQTAIAFPKYEQGGAIGGSNEIDDTQEQQRQAKDIDDILGSDIYKALEQRKLKRQSIIKNEAMNRALEEREKALNNLKIS